jgi:hypothetical protein
MWETLWQYPAVAFFGSVTAEEWTQAFFSIHNATSSKQILILYMTKVPLQLHFADKSSNLISFDHVRYHHRWQQWHKRQGQLTLEVIFGSGYNAHNHRWLQRGGTENCNEKNF